MNRFYIILIFSTIAAACTKDNESICYICTTTYIETTDVPVAGYPLIIPFETKLCDITETEADEFEQTNKGTEVVIYNNITYTTTHTTDCQKE